MGMVNLPIFPCPYKTLCHLYTYGSAKPSGVLSSPNSQSNFSQLALSSALPAASESLLMHSSTEGFVCAKLKYCAWKTLLSSVRWGAKCRQRESSMLKIFVFVSLSETTHFASFFFSDSCLSAACSHCCLTRPPPCFACALQLPTFCLRCSLMHRQASWSQRWNTKALP